MEPKPFVGEAEMGRMQVTSKEAHPCCRPNPTLWREQLHAVQGDSVEASGESYRESHSDWRANSIKATTDHFRSAKLSHELSQA